jgi:MoaA/NifB/PqqE/SkfB family radical SAM enzyme
MRSLKLTDYIPTIKGLWGNLTSNQAIYPFYASFKVTSRCHFGCPFCNIRYDKVPDLSTDQIKAILDNLSRSPVLLTSFEGGEPLLRSDILELLKYARTKAFYLLFTTSVRNLLEYPLEEYSKYIDFFHVSIDEGHNNLELFDILPTLVKLPTQVSVQTVVTRQTVASLDEKVKRCYDCGANIVIIPAAHMDGTDDYFPDIIEFEKKLLNLRRKYPHTIHTPQGFFKAYQDRKCSSASVIIAPDGRLYYPCHILATKGPDLSTVDLAGWLKSEEAVQMRKTMKECKRNCGWYQYYSIASYTSIGSVMDAINPVFARKKSVSPS